MSAKAGSFTRRCRRTRRGTITIFMDCCKRSPASTSPATSTMSASGICASRSRKNIRRAASSSPATPPIRIRPTAATASTTGSTTSPISAGSLRPNSRVGETTPCCRPIPKSGGRFSRRRRKISSRPAFRKTPLFSPATARKKTERNSSAPGKNTKAPRRRACSPTSRITKARRSCSVRRTARCSARGTHTFKARAGHHLPPQLLSSGRNVFEELGPYFTLLAFAADDRAIASFAEAAEALGVPLKIVCDAYQDGRKAYEAKLILVRPDRYVAWTANAAPSDVKTILSKVVGRA